MIHTKLFIIRTSSCCLFSIHLFIFIFFFIFFVVIIKYILFINSQQSVGYIVYILYAWIFKACQRVFLNVYNFFCIYIFNCFPLCMIYIFFFSLFFLKIFNKLRHIFYPTIFAVS